MFKMLIAFICALLVAVLVALVFFFLWKNERDERVDIEKECRRKEQYISHLEKSNAKLRKEIEARNEREKEAYEKLNALHIGGVNAALAELSNNKSKQ